MRTPKSLWRVAVAALLLAGAARADEVDLTQTGRRGGRSNKPPTIVLRAEGGNDFSPFGLAGGCLSYYNSDGDVEVEAGAGAGFPGLQLGLALRKLFGEDGNYLVTELSIAGNTQVNRGVDSHLVDRRAGGSNGKLWSSLGLGFEHRAGFLSVGGVAALAFTASLDAIPHFMVHGGIGLGF